MILFKNFLKPIFHEYFVLADINTNTVLNIGRNFQTINYMRDFFMDTHVVFLYVKNKLDNNIIESLILSKDFSSFKIGGENNFLMKNISIDESLKKKADLVVHKFEIFEKMYSMIEQRRIRQSQKRTLAFQEFIYLNKKIQAKDFLEKNCPEEKILEYSYVKQYAEIKKISYKQSAEEILLKSTLNDVFLARTERVRMIFFNKLKNADSRETIDLVFRDFKAELEE